MPINFDTVKRIYVGRDNCCRCGCHGSYHEEGSRGFKMALSRARKVIESSESAIEEHCAEYANVITGKDRAITLYFTN